jgi:serine/threonine protein phosphatase PrpC
VLWWALVGDSEAIIARPTIGHKQLTTLDHKPRARRHQGIGDTAYRGARKGRVAVGGQMPDDMRVVVASDSLWDVLDHRRVARIVGRWGYDVQATAKELVRRAMDKCTTDNVSVLVFMPKRLE